MNIRNIIILTNNENEILLKEDNSFFELYTKKAEELLDGNIKKYIGEYIEGEFEDLNIISKKKINYYGEEVVYIYVEVKKHYTFSKLKKFNKETDKFDSVYINAIEEYHLKKWNYRDTNLKKCTIIEERVIKVDRKDCIFSIIIGILCGIFMFYGASDINYFGVWVTLVSFAVAIYLVYSKKTEIKNKIGAVILVSGLVLSVTFSIFTNEMFRAINLVAVPIMILYGSKLLITKSYDLTLVRFIGQALESTIISPLQRVSNIRVFDTFRKRGTVKDKQKYKEIMIGLGISAPIVIVLATILSSGDENFKNMILSIFTVNLDIDKNIILAVLVALIISIYLIAYSKSANMLLEKQFESEKNINVNLRILNTVFTMINALYFMFLVSQFVKVGDSYSSNARAGFFQLIFVVFINISAIIFFKNITKENKLTKILFAIMTLLSMNMSIRSIMALKSYVEALGFTRLRFLSLVFAVFLLIVLVLLLINLFKQFKVWNYIIIIGIVIYIGLNYCNMDSLIVNYNTSNFNESGNVKVLDKEYLDTLSNDYQNPKIQNNTNKKWFEFNYYNN